MHDRQRHAGPRPLFTFLFLLIATGVAAAALATALQHGSGAETPDPETLELGREVYASQCMSCHGPEGEGDGPAARFLDVQPRNLSVGEWQYAEAGTVDAIAEVVAEGIPDTPMEPFEELLPEAEIRAVATYVIHEIVPEHEEERQP